MDVINVPVAPDTAVVSLGAGVRFAIAGASVWLNIGANAREIREGSYTWDQAAGDFTAYSLTVPATVWICVTAPTAAAAPTWTPGPAPSVCVAPATPEPAQTGQIPDLAFAIPTLVVLPSMTPAATITATLIISPAHTAISLIMQPVQTAAAWCAGAFGADGYARAQVDAAPVVAGVGEAFGWLAVLGAIGPLAWLLPPLLITVLVKVARPILSAVKYIKQIIPFQ